MLKLFKYRDKNLRKKYEEIEKVITWFKLC